MNFDKVTADNFLIYATKMYDANQAADIEEFNFDLRRFSSTKRLLLRFCRNTNQVNIRMLLNHIIILSNLFGIKATPRLLFFYCPEETYPSLLSILNFLSITPNFLAEANIEEIEPCKKMINSLERL